MNYLSAKEVAERWGITDRSVRKYCTDGRIPGAFLNGKTWNIPEDAEKPKRAVRSDKRPDTLLDILKEQKSSRLSGGIYHRIQIDFTYSSNHIEGSRLSHEQTRYIFDTNTIGFTQETLNVDDIVETVNHFKCIDYIIDSAEYDLSERYIRELHRILKSGTSDSRKDWFAVGDYKKLPNQIGGMVETTQPEEVHGRMKTLISEYKAKNEVSFEDILDFHVRFERIHPFQDGNGRVGRLIMFKECLKHDITPFIISDDLKFYYNRGLNEWDNERGFLMDTCKFAQDVFLGILKYFRIFER